MTDSTKIIRWDWRFTKKNYSLEYYMIEIPEKTGKVYKYKYEKLLSDFTYKYMRENHPTVKYGSFKNTRWNKETVIEGKTYLYNSIKIFNHKSERNQVLFKIDGSYEFKKSFPAIPLLNLIEENRTPKLTRHWNGDQKNYSYYK